ncbi:MAG: hypothetical protein IJS14_06435 [Lentisphaeria bacterium]|nr:hypothetical protein [Lentisphaeria bacterium]
MKKLTSLRTVLWLALCLAAVAVSARETELRMGVYIYDYAFRRMAEGYGEDLKSFVEKHFTYLQKNHVNAIHLTVANSNGKDFREVWLPLMKKYGIKAYLQLDFAYFRGGAADWKEPLEDKQAERAANFIQEFKDEPMIMGFSIREEVSQAQVNAMARYYAKIQALVPGFKIFTLHNNLGAAKDQPVPDPAVMGTDRYCFWWEFSANGYLATPSFALNWLRTDADRYYWEAAKRGADYVFVLTANAFVGGRTLETWKEWGEKKPKMLAKIEQFSKDQRFGWKQAEASGEPMMWYWKYYRPPVNCTRAMIWTGILEGARCVLFWSYTPVEKNRLDKTVEQVLTDLMADAKAKKKAKATVHYNWTTMAGRPGLPNQPMEEFAATAEELKPYSRLICMMSKLPDSPVKTEVKKKIYNRAFSVTGYKGRVIVLQNANVGTWGAKSSGFFSDKDDIRVNDNGDLIGYTPFKDKRTAEFTVTGSDPVFDFASGQEIKLDGGKGKVELLPGGGTMLFIGTQEEFGKLKTAAAAE